MFATVLGLISMIPLTFLAIAPIFAPSKADWGELNTPEPGSRRSTARAFFTNLYGHGWLTIYIAFAFLLTWNVIAMEAAACYIGECRDPERDAKIAMNLEGALRPLHLHDDPDQLHGRDRHPRINEYVTRWEAWSTPNQIFVDLRQRAVFGARARTGSTT